jgi:hypothetical protein
MMLRKIKFDVFGDCFSFLVLLFLFQFSKITLVRVFVGIAKIYHQKLLKLNSKRETFPLRINVV